MSKITVAGVRGNVKELLHYSNEVRPTPSQDFSTQR